MFLAFEVLLHQAAALGNSISASKARAPRLRALPADHAAP